MKQISPSKLYVTNKHAKFIGVISANLIFPKVNTQINSLQHLNGQTD